MKSATAGANNRSKEAEDAAAQAERVKCIVRMQQRQWLHSAIVERHDQVMQRDVDGVGARRELVLDDGHGNLLSDMVALAGVDLKGH